MGKDGGTVDLKTGLPSNAHWRILGTKSGGLVTRCCAVPDLPASLPDGWYYCLTLFTGKSIVAPSYEETQSHRAGEK